MLKFNGRELDEVNGAEIYIVLQNPISVKSDEELEEICNRHEHRIDELFYGSGYDLDMEVSYCYNGLAIHIRNISLTAYDMERHFMDIADRIQEETFDDAIPHAVVCFNKDEDDIVDVNDFIYRLDY